MIENKQNCVVQTPKEFIGFEPIEIITKKFNFISKKFYQK